MEVNHITPRRGLPITTRGCLHHLDGLETLCGPHHRRVSKYEERAALGLPTFLHPDDGWLPGDTVTVTDIGRMLDMNRGNLSGQIGAWHFPDPMQGRQKRLGRKTHLTWHTPEIVLWACQKGFLDYWDLHPHLAAMLPAEVAA